MIFADTAPRYWERNIPVIPLKVAGKMPIIGKWQMYCDRMPTKEEQDIWLRAFPSNNIGLPLGPASGMCAIDIDNEDPEVMAAISEVIPDSPWIRIGKKGAVMVYRWEGQRTFKIQNSELGTLIECRSKGAQIAIPPSIHPDTMQPYTANCELLDVLWNLPSLGEGTEKKLREAFNDHGIKVGSSGNTKVLSFVPSGARDNSMTAMAGMYSRGVWRGERTLVQALAEIKAWVENFTEKVAGDDVSTEKAQKKLIEFLIKDVTGDKNIALPVGWDEGLTEEEKGQLGLAFTVEQEMWSAERIKKWLTDSFEEHTEIMSAPWMSAVEVALSKIARNPTITSLEQDVLVKYIANQSGKALNLGSLKKRISDLQKSEREGANHSEIAEYVINDFSKFGELRHHAGLFWQWRGANWENVDPTRFYKHIAEEYGAFPAARRASDHVGIVKVMASLVAKDLKMVEVNGLNFANGYLTEDLELMPHNPDYGCQYVLPYRYLPEKAGQCPQFFQYLQDCWGLDADCADKIDLLQEFMGATMFSVAWKYEVALCLYGLGKTGKTRLIEIMKGLLPEGCTSEVSPENWGDKFMPTEMYGKLMNIAGELSEHRRIEGNSFKHIVSGGGITGQRKNGPLFDFKATCSHWFSANHYPQTRDTSDGFLRRWRFLTYNHPIDEAKKIIDLDRVILAAEREEIAAWAVQGMMRLKKNGHFTEPMSHLAMIDSVANDVNSVRYFLQNCNEIDFDSSSVITDAELFKKYFSFCITTQAAKPTTQRIFQKLMLGLEGQFSIKRRVSGKDLIEYEGIKSTR